MIAIDGEQDIARPVCGATMVDSEKLRKQPSCPHVRFVYCNGEAFEYCDPDLEALLAKEAQTDEREELFDMWEALLQDCRPCDLILEQNEEGMACGPTSFTVWVGICSRN